MYVRVFTRALGLVESGQACLFLQKLFINDLLAHTNATQTILRM